MQVMVLGGEEGLECEVCEDGIRLEHVSELFEVWFGRMRQIVVGRCRVGGGVQAALGGVRQ